MASARSWSMRSGVRCDCDRASPSGSLTTGGIDNLETGNRRSLAIALSTANCWASLRPNMAMSGCSPAKSLATTVATPMKWPGR